MNNEIIRRPSKLACLVVAVATVVGCGRREGESTRVESKTPTNVVFTPGEIRQTPLEASPAGGRFVRLSPSSSGLDFLNRLVLDHPLKRIYNSGFVCGGVAIGDVDQNGRPDVYCVSGPNANRLYLQTGPLQFEDVTEAAKVSGGDRWGAGAALKDIDNDGDLDIYVCNYESPNQLFLNNGDGSFDELAESFGLDVTNSSVMPSFCDYDCDGDLDMYLLTNRIFRAGGRPKDPPFQLVDGKPHVKPEFAKFYALTRKASGGYGMDDYGQPDALFENLGNGEFKEVTELAGIAGNGFGLSATWWDYNMDGLPDLYVANDYNDPDCLYRNDGNGKFTNVLKDALPHTPWFSMGADFGDLNNDGLFDFLVVDMSATNHFAQKTTMGAMNAKKLALVAGPPPQLMRNSLYVNTGTHRFQEAAFLAGLANSDWSWSVKIADFDCDGKQDVFITNGMVRNVNHSDRPITDAMKISREEWDYYVDTPTRPEQNLVFRNEGEFKFSDVSEAWGLDHVGMSYAAATSDLDGDGDLDIVVTNLEEPVSIYRNDLTSADAKSNRVTIRLHGTTSNSHGVGAIVSLVSPGGEQVKQLASSTGYLADNESILQFGVGADETISTIKVEWPSGHRQTIDDVAVNHRIDIVEPSGIPTQHAEDNIEAKDPMFVGGPITAYHHDEYFDDFKIQPLLPNQLSQFGPDLTIGDVNRDQLPDLFLTGSTGQSGQLFLRDSSGSLTLTPQPAFAADAAAEDLGAHFFDADDDGDLDLYVASGSVENIDRQHRFQDRLYLNDGDGKFSLATDAIPPNRDSTASVSSCDFDKDGDLDLFVGGRLVPGQYPLSPVSRILQNKAGKFIDVTERLAPSLMTAGMVTSSTWSDVDGDGWTDLMLTVEWGPVRYLKNQQGTFVEHTVQAKLSERTGWWNDIAAADFDGDGDLDFVVTNFGLNTKYHASPEHPALLYYGDFEQNGKMKLVEAEQENETWFPIRGKSCSTHAMPHLADKFKTYEDFALASLGDIYTEQCLNDSYRFAATELRSGVLINDVGMSFRFAPLPRIAQISPSLAVVTADFNQDQHTDIFMAQNFFVPQPETGRMDSGLGQLLLGAGDGTFSSVRPDASGILIPNDARAALAVDLNCDGLMDIVVATNNGPIHVWINQSTDFQK